MGCAGNGARDYGVFDLFLYQKHTERRRSKNLSLGSRFYHELNTKKTLKIYKEDACGSCKLNKWPNKKVGRTCCLSYPTVATDYYRKKVVLTCEEDLYAMHLSDSQKQVDAFEVRSGRKVRPDDLLDWMVKRGICPYGIISKNTKYWLELMSIYDGEMGITMPLKYDELPSVFFEVLRIHRDSRPVAPKEE